MQTASFKRALEEAHEILDRRSGKQPATQHKPVDFKAMPAARLEFGQDTSMAARHRDSAYHAAKQACESQRLRSCGISPCDLMDQLRWLNNGKGSMCPELRNAVATHIAVQPASNAQACKDSSLQLSLQSGHQHRMETLVVSLCIHSQRPQAQESVQGWHAHAICSAAGKELRPSQRQLTVADAEAACANAALTMLTLPDQSMQRQSIVLITGCMQGWHADDDLPNSGDEAALKPPEAAATAADAKAASADAALTLLQGLARGLYSMQV